MRILHTSDWHLGKQLGEFSRLGEQIAFIDELAEMADEREIDLILIAGDVYDTVVPPSAAEHLFFNAMKRLSMGGKRPIVVIAGNHDSPLRLTASSALVTQLGIIIFGIPDTIVPVGDFGHFSILDSAEGYIELDIVGEKAIILAMPYPSEKRLNKILGSIGDEREHRRSYSEQIGDIFNKLSGKFREDTVNLAIGHFYVRGGEVSGSERDISLGGGYAVSPEALPANAGYIALGHLHRAQRVHNLARAHYSGSPIAYDISESHQAKCVLIADVGLGFDIDPKVEKVYLKCHKPFIMIEADSAAEAAEKIASEAGTCWMTVRINSGRPLAASEIKEVRSAGGDVLSIACDTPVGDGFDEGYGLMSFDNQVNKPEYEFENFYMEKRGIKPTGEMTALFLELINMRSYAVGGDS